MASQQVLPQATMSAQQAQFLLWAALSDTLIQQYITVTARTIFIFYYIDRLEEEVEKIWPERWSLGKVLFLVTTYSLMARIVVDVFSVFPTVPMSDQSCWGATVAVQILNLIHTYAPTGSILLCLHALMGAERKSLVAIATGYSLHLVFAIFLIGFWLADLHARPTTYPTSKFSTCMFHQGRPNLNIILTYANVCREAILMLLGAVVVYTRYRGHHTTLIRAIRRDGGIYLISVFVLGLVAALLRTPGFPIYDRYAVIQELRTIAYPILANRLLLNMRESDDWRTRKAVSVLIFQRSPIQTDSVLGEIPFDDEDDETPLTSLATGISDRSSGFSSRSAGGSRGNRTVSAV